MTNQVNSQQGADSKDQTSVGGGGKLAATMTPRHVMQDEQHIGRGSKRRSMSGAGGGGANAHYDQLIGAIDQGTSSTRFLVFERGTGRLVASSQIEIKRITPREGWVEIDPNTIMSSVYATMANVHDQLMAKQHQLAGFHQLEQTTTTTTANTDESRHWLGQQSQANHITSSSTFMDQKCTSSNNVFNPSQLLRCIGICNQRESAVVWDSKTGQPLYNVIVWMDNRTKDIVDDMIDSIPGRDFNHLKDKTGLPMSTYFSAFKLRWLIDNVPEVQAALREKRLLVGTVDSWILWNLTGKHLTDVTNASRTFLMDIETLQWDKTLCKQFKVPMEILPKILSSADDFGALQFGPFMGTPITGVIGDQSAALFGHNCLQLGQTKATFGTGCFIMQNIGPGPLNGALSGVQREAKRGLITTVGYKLKDKPVCYALEGSVKIAGAALTWLRDNMQLIENYEECDQLVNTTTNSAGVFFVPALGGLYSPYWDPNAAGLFIGLSQFSRREHLVRATFDSVAFQTNDILSLMRGVTNGLMIDGGLCKSDNLCQILADITGCDINRPSMCETSALGAAMVAGCGAGIWDYDSMMAHSNTPHEYACSSHQTHHYPHESLNYDENKFAHHHHHSHNHSQQATTKCFKASGSNKQAASGQQQQQHQQQQQEANNQKNQAAQQQPSKLHRRSLRHRRGGRLMRNLDAGGGINDDAGGGGGGGGGGSGPPLESPASRYSSDDRDDEDEMINDDEREEDIDSMSAGHMASSDADFDLGVVVLSSESSTSGDGKADEFIDRSSVEAVNTSASPLPAVIENHAYESSYESSSTGGEGKSAPLVAAAGQKAPRTTTLTNLINNLGGLRGGPAPPCSSSGYSSGDNFESNSTSSCQLTDSIRLSESGSHSGRKGADSPALSQATTGADATPMSGRDSVATCTEDLSTINVGVAEPKLQAVPSRRHPSNDDKSVQGSPPTFPFNLTNYMTNQETITGPNQHVASLNDSDRTITTATTVIEQVGHQVNNRKFVETAEDVADEVHEFGGRDSYGEDGYDSSTVSFDSYEDDDADDNGRVIDDVSEIKQDNDNGNDDCRNRAVEEENNKATTHYDVISNNKSTTIATGDQQAYATGGGHSHHRRSLRQASLVEKQMDVFQPYISLEHRTELVDTWRSAVSRSMQWTKVHHEEVRRIDYQRLSSLPISMYVFFSLGLVALSGCLSPSSLMSN